MQVLLLVLRLIGEERPAQKSHKVFLLNVLFVAVV